MTSSIGLAAQPQLPDMQIFPSGMFRGSTSGIGGQSTISYARYDATPTHHFQYKSGSSRFIIPGRGYEYSAKGTWGKGQIQKFNPRKQISGSAGYLKPNNAMRPNKTQMVLSNIGRVVKPAFLPRGGNIMRVVGRQEDDAPIDDDPSGNPSTERRNAALVAGVETQTDNTNATGTGAGVTASKSSNFTQTIQPSTVSTEIQTDVDAKYQKLKEELTLSMAESDALERKLKANRDASASTLHQINEEKRALLQQIDKAVKEITILKRKIDSLEQSGGVNERQKKLYLGMKARTQIYDEQIANYNIKVQELESEIAKLTSSNKKLQAELSSRKPSPSMKSTGTNSSSPAMQSKATGPDSPPSSSSSENKGKNRYEEGVGQGDKADITYFQNINNRMKNFEIKARTRSEQKTTSILSQNVRNLWQQYGQVVKTTRKYGIARSQTEHLMMLIDEKYYQEFIKVIGKFMADLSL